MIRVSEEIIALMGRMHLISLYNRTTPFSCHKDVLIVKELFWEVEILALRGRIFEIL